MRHKTYILEKLDCRFCEHKRIGTSYDVYIFNNWIVLVLHVQNFASLKLLKIIKSLSLDIIIFSLLGKLHIPKKVFFKG